MSRYLPLAILLLCMKSVRWKLLKLSCQNQSVDGRTNLIPIGRPTSGGALIQTRWLYISGNLCICPNVWGKPSRHTTLFQRWTTNFQRWYNVIDFNVRNTTNFNVVSMSDFNVETALDLNVETSDFNVETTSDFNVETMSYFNVETTPYFNVETSYFNVETTSDFNVDPF